MLFRIQIVKRNTVVFYFTQPFSDIVMSNDNKCSCGSVVELCVSSAEVVGSIPRNTHTDKMYNLNAL